MLEVFHGLMIVDTRKGRNFFHKNLIYMISKAKSTFPLLVSDWEKTANLLNTM